MKTRELAVVAALTAACTKATPARDQVVVALDTDLPVPAWVDRVRVEVFDPTGTRPIDARDFAVPNVDDWPISFGLRPSADQGAVDVLLRIRAYNSLRTSSLWAQAQPGQTLGNGPDGADAMSTVDRLARISSPPGGAVANARVVLRGDCLGIAADVAGGTTCIDATSPRAAAPTVPLTGGADTTRLVGTWKGGVETDCSVPVRGPSALLDEQLCMSGTTFIFGDVRTDHVIPDGGALLSIPEHLVQLSPFVLDRYEVSVARFRAAVNDPVRPFVPPVEPTLHDPVADGFDGGVDCSVAVNFRFCTWRGKTGATSPEIDALPLNCVTYETARAFCQWDGGDLPTEAQWEYAAIQSHRTAKTIYPWTGATVSCDVASFSRWNLEADTGECGRDVTCGPLSVAAPFGAGPAPAGCQGTSCVRDETPNPGGPGLVGMGGNVSEWVRDLAAPLDADCWTSAPRLDPVCDHDPSVKAHMFRGGSWILARNFTEAIIRVGGLDSPTTALLPLYGAVGFRCARPGASAP